MENCFYKLKFFISIKNTNANITPSRLGVICLPPSESACLCHSVQVPSRYQFQGDQSCRVRKVGKTRSNVLSSPQDCGHTLGRVLPTSSLNSDFACKFFGYQPSKFRFVEPSYALVKVLSIRC